MALTYDQISAITERKFIPKLIDNVFDTDPLLQRSKKKGWYEKIDGSGNLLATHMPASTFYHVFCAIAEANRVLL